MTIMKCFLKIIVDSIVIVTYCCKLRPPRHASFVVCSTHVQWYIFFLRRMYNGTFEKLTKKNNHAAFATFLL